MQEKFRCSDETLNMIMPRYVKRTERNRHLHYLRKFFNLEISVKDLLNGSIYMLDYFDRALWVLIK